VVRRIGLVGGLVVVLAASVYAQPPGGGRGFGRGTPQSAAMLLGMEEVRAELETTDEQNKQLEELTADVRSRMREAFGDFQSQQNLSDEERSKRRDESRKKMEEINKEADAKIATILKSEQAERLNQLRLQREGVYALARADVAETLALTQEQKEKVAKIVEAGQQQGANRNFRDLSDEERQKAFAEMREQREKTEADLAAVLTADQKTEWERMQGEKFEFPQGRFGGGQRSSN